MDRSGVLVRPATYGDLHAVNDIYNHYVRTSHVTFDLEPTSLAWRRSWFEEHDNPLHRVLVGVVDERVAGYAASSRFRHRAGYDTSVETSVYVAPTSLGLGIGKSLYAGLFDALADQPLHRAQAGIALPNEASVALHRRFGFELVGRFTEQGWKFGRFWDVEWYERPMGGTPPASGGGPNTP